MQNRRRLPVRFLCSRSFLTMFALKTATRRRRTRSSARRPRSRGTPRPARRSSLSPTRCCSSSRCPPACPHRCCCWPLSFILPSNFLFPSWILLFFAQSYIWDVDKPNSPDAEIVSPAPLTSLVYNPRTPDHLVGGTYTGIVCELESELDLCAAALLLKLKVED